MIGPNRSSEASEDPIAQRTTNSSYEFIPITDTTFHFHPIDVKNLVLALVKLNINKSTGLLIIQ